MTENIICEKCGNKMAHDEEVIILSEHQGIDIPMTVKHYHPGCAPEKLKEVLN